MSSRDDFSQKSKEALAKRVAFHCSNPACRAKTVGPKSNAEEALVLGVAAHITAAAAGGPRYDQSLSKEERKSVSNGIWTCIKCSVLVDKDPSPYSVETLLQWKTEAEQEARDNLVNPQETAGKIQIRATFDRFKIYKDNRNPGDSVVFIDGFGRGDVRYSFEYCLYLNSKHPITVHRFRVEFRKGTELIHSDKYAIQKEIELLPHRWVKKNVVYGVHRSKLDKIYTVSDAMWLSIQTIGENVKFDWKIADLATPYASLPWLG